jgi:uncharacterized protein (TIGR04551 family)
VRARRRRGCVVKVRTGFVLGAAAAAAITLLARSAAAQYGGGGFGAPGGGGMQPAPPMGQEPKEEGPAQEAPEEEGRPPELEPLTGYNEQGRRKLQVVELNGYLRLRADYMHNFFLGQGYTHVADTAEGLSFGKPPFPTPLECANPNPPFANSGNDPVNNQFGNCGHKNVGGANLRLRIEPTLNVTDQVRVRAQFDVLDNTLLGSTPDSLAGIPGYNRTPTVSSTNTSTLPGGTQPIIPPGIAPDSYLYTSQDPPEVGQNGFVSSVRAKRAWAEVDGEFGSIRFGRMPWHWGRGMLFNDGSCPDCDAGINVDRVMGLTQIYGHQIAAAWDLGTQGFNSQELDIGRNNPGSYPIDLSQNDDVLELMASVSKIDTPVSLRERQDRGDVVVNYGLQLVYRNQGNAIQPAVPNATTFAGMTPFGPQPPSRDQIPPTGQPPNKEINAILFTPDLWFKLYWKALTIEFEGAGVIGKVDHPGYLAVDDTRTTFLQWGYVLASELRLFRDSFFVGLETGGASGDQAEDPSQYLNYRWHFIQQPHGDHSITDFHFNPDYHIDEILWRHIMGTVSNAFYIKPQTAYWFDLGQTRAIGLLGGVIFSMAEIPVSTPGNSLPYGFEMNVGATYRNSAEGFYGGFTWAVLWPFGALDRPQSIWGQDAANATAAQLLRVFMGVRF